MVEVYFPSFKKKKINLRGGDFTDYLPFTDYLSFKKEISKTDLRYLINTLKNFLVSVYIHKPYINKDGKEILKKYSRLSMLNVSKIKQMGGLFEGFPFHLMDTEYVKKYIDSKEFKEVTGIKKFDIDITGWDVSNVVNMNDMFKNSKNFNQDLSKWNVTNVKYMEHMFESCVEFNQDLSKWNDKLINLEKSRDAFEGCNINEKYIPQKMTNEEQTNRNSKAEGKKREQAYLNRLASERDT